MSRRSSASLAATRTAGSGCTFAMKAPEPPASRITVTARSREGSGSVASMAVTRASASAIAWSARAVTDDAVIEVKSSGIDAG